MSRRIATIGFFDGVHLGHRFLIGQVLDIAQKNGAESLIVTMYPHPRAIVQPGFQPQLLTTLDEKLNLLKKTGISKVEVLQFDKEMSRLSARDFMEQVLHEKLGIDCLVMGYDHRFGHGGGTMEQYREWGKGLGIEVLQMEAFSSEYVSSSAIRKLLLQGNVEKAAKLLGRPYELCGNVVDGYKVGRTIGFPTANLCPEKGKLIPAPGVYAVWAILPDGRRFKGMLNIGNRPTLDNGDGISIEVHLLHFKGDLYNKPLRLLFGNRVRDEHCFGSLEELQLQLRQDAVSAELLLG